MGRRVVRELSLVVAARDHPSVGVEHDRPHGHVAMVCGRPRFFKCESHCIGGAIVTVWDGAHAGQATAAPGELRRDGGRTRSCNGRRAERDIKRLLCTVAGERHFH